ncbi:enoyl-CoA hydratase/isomerase family protein [soil metagenome]
MTDAAPGSPVEPPLIVERRGRVGHLLLNRPRALNALNGEMVRIMAEALEQWHGDDTVATVLLTGAGDRGLCAGGDIVSIYNDARNGGTASEQFWRDEYRLNAMIASYPKPFVAVQDGIVLGGGIGISAHAGIRIVTETSKLGMPETGIGFVPDVGGTWLLARAPGELGTHLGLTAGSAGPADAIHLGLSDFFVERAALPALFAALETDDAAAAVQRVASMPPAGDLADARWVDAAYAGDDVGQIVARLATSSQPAAQEAHAAIVAKSPTALAATLASLRRARLAPDLQTVLASEFRVSLRFLAEPDLAEGIRAAVIDKDRSPTWRPPSIDEVDPAHVETFFAPLGDRELDVSEQRSTA